MPFYEELIQEILKKKPSKVELEKLKRRISAKYKVKNHPSDIQILLHATSEE